MEAPDQPGQDKEDKEAPKHLKNLEARKTALELEAKLGKTEILAKDV